MGVVRIVRGAVLLTAAGVAVAKAVQRRGEVGRAQLMPGRPPEPAAEVEAPPVAAAPPVEDPPVEEPPVGDPPVEIQVEEPPEEQRPAAQQPPASVTDIVDDLLAPYRERDARIEDATVVESPSGGDPERQTGT